jgi:hypothetical protein
MPDQEDDADALSQPEAAAWLALVHAYNLDADVAVPDLEWAAAQWREGQRMMAGPTSPEVAAELEGLAGCLEGLSEEAIRALCVGVAPEMAPWRPGMAEQLAAHVRSVATTYRLAGRPRRAAAVKEGGAGVRYVLHPQSRRNLEHHAMRSVLGTLILAWSRSSTTYHPSDRLVRAYRNLTAEEGWAGNRGAHFVREAAALVTGRPPPPSRRSRASYRDQLAGVAGHRR